ncbi:MAG: HEAT repeat domain-containing protein [Deltaproteobacteria bacterium]|nr:MAG: HEAT repeat domain-containing protein [Deltaproteobacteria bacterium]
MRGRVRAPLLALATITIPALALAQFPLDQQGRRGLRDRYNRPQTDQKLDENVRKLNGDDPEARLEAVRALGEINEPKAVDYLLQAANDPDTRIRIKAIDTLGNAHAKEATGLLIQQLFLRGRSARRGPDPRHPVARHRPGRTRQRDLRTRRDRRPRSVAGARRVREGRSGRRAPPPGRRGGTQDP